MSTLLEVKAEICELVEIKGMEPALIVNNGDLSTYAVVVDGHDSDSYPATLDDLEEPEVIIRNGDLLVNWPIAVRAAA